MDTDRGTGMSRRLLLRRGAAIPAAAFAGRGVYSLLDQLVAPPRALAANVTRRQEQYLIDNLEVIIDNNTPVIIPPVFNDVFTAKLAPGRTWDKAALVAAQKRLESALARVESPYTATAAGLTILVAWGLPYFREVRGDAVEREGAARPAASEGEQRVPVRRHRRSRIPQRSRRCHLGAERRGVQTPQRLTADPAVFQQSE